MSTKTQEVINTTVAPEIKPQYRALIGRAEILFAKQRAKWEKYTGKRFADFTPTQKAYFKKATKMGVDPRTINAANLTNRGINSLLKQNYKTSTFARKGTDVKAAQGNYNQKLKDFGIKNADNIKQLKPWQVKEIKAAQGNYNQKLKDFDIKGIKGVTAPKNLAKQTARMDAAQTGFKDKVGTKSFTTAAAQAGMSPYMQSVVGIQQREAQRQADIAGTERSAKAVQSGAFGGSRQAIMDAEAARNLEQQKGDIQAQGSQKAYEDAQQQFNQQQQLGLTAQQSNQQTGLQAALANMNSKQQANVQNQAAINQSKGMSAQQAMQAAIQNQNTKLQQAQSNQRGRLETQGLDSANRQQMNLQNLQNQQQTAITNQADQLMAEGKSREQAIQIATQNQTQRFSRAIANQQANLGVQQLDSGYRQQTNMQNLQNRQQSGLANQANRFERERADEASRQYGANYAYQGRMGALQGANQLAGLGRDAYGQRVNNLGLLKDVGGMQQARDQNLLNVDYQNFIDSKNYPLEQLQLQANLYGNLGNNMTSQSSYRAPPGMFTQGVGAAAALAGYNYQQPRTSTSIGLGGARGGMVPSGLVDLAMYRAYA